jgi:hypothetical protein
MRLAPSVACFLVAWDCVEKAIGVEPQHIVAPSALWLWWMIAALWVLTGIGVWVER